VGDQYYGVPFVIKPKVMAVNLALFKKPVSQPPALDSAHDGAKPDGACASIINFRAASAGGVSRVRFAVRGKEIASWATSQP